MPNILTIVQIDGGYRGEVRTEKGVLRQALSGPSIAEIKLIASARFGDDLAVQDETPAPAPPIADKPEPAAVPDDIKKPTPKKTTKVKEAHRP